MIGCIRAVAPYGPAVGTEDAEGFVARSPGVREPLSPASPGTRARAQDRELIAAAPSRGARPREEAMRRPGGSRRVKAPRQFRSYRMDRWRGRSMAARVAILGVLASLLTALPVASSVTTSAHAADTCPADGCAVTVDA